ncbi:MAG: RHS repeat protein [Nitrospirales bacterium]|nr:RHS repeat protein [Nitrospirales bacterium]MBA3753866.1 RHS repeat protein [Nitrospira sp.]
MTRTTTRMLDGAGRLLSLKTALGNVTAYNTDALNRVTQLTDAIYCQNQGTTVPRSIR